MGKGEETSKDWNLGGVCDIDFRAIYTPDKSSTNFVLINRTLFSEVFYDRPNFTVCAVFLLLFVL